MGSQAVKHPVKIEIERNKLVHLGIRLNPDDDLRLTALAELSGKKKSSLARDLLRHGIKQLERQ